MSMKVKDLTEQVNLLINKALGGNLTAAQIEGVLNAQATALAAVAPVPTHDRTIQDPGKPLNPAQP